MLLNTNKNYRTVIRNVKKVLIDQISSTHNIFISEKKLRHL